MLLDVHTHRLPDDASTALLSCSLRNVPLPKEARFLSVGIHPWYITREDYGSQMEWVERMLDDRRVIALGEAGLDKRCATPFDLQLVAFRYVAQLADKRGLPLLIHAVKATEELFAVKKEMCPRNAWIIHGFRGKKELAESLLGQGFYLSFGEKYQPEALRITPEDRLLLETDEATADIADVYERAARERKRGLEELTAKVQETINRLFFNQ